jgi:adenylate cyclase
MSAAQKRAGQATRTARTRRGLLLVVALLSVTVGLVTYATGALHALDLDTMNIRFEVRGTQKPPPNIVIVAIDDQSFANLHTSWPFCYSRHGQLINDIAAQHPAAIAFDIQLSDPPHPGCGGQADQLALINAIGNANGRVILGWQADEPNGNVELVGAAQGSAILQQIGGHAASTLVPPDPGYVDRRVAYRIDNLKTLAVVTSEVATGRPVSPKPFGGVNGTGWIDYAGPENTFPQVSLYRVMLHQLPPNFFRNKIVVVGATTTSLQDIHATPTSPLMTGPEIQANSISTVLRDLPLRSVPGWINVVLIILLGAAPALAGLRFGGAGTGSLGSALSGALSSVGLALVLALVFLGGAQLAFNGGDVLSIVYVLLALALSAVAALAVHLILGAMERERVRDLFARFVPQDVVDDVLARTDGLRLGGVQRDATVMFTDLRGFTSFAESLTPPRVIEVLNRYLSEMSEAILGHRGTLVSYMGDGIFAVFGAPLEDPRHAEQALACAQEMLSVRLPRFNAWLKEEGLSEGFRMGIGLNSGHVMSGNVGSEQRVEYAAVGDTTNSASRLESLTKGTPHQLFFSETTKDELREEPPGLLFVQEVQLRGRVGKMGVWTIAEDGAGAEPAGPDDDAEPVAAAGAEAETEAQ